MFQKKKLRYYYWIIIEFTKKNARLLLLSFFLSIIFIISIVSLSPYLINITTTRKQIIGMIGTPDVNTIPEEVLSKISNGLIFVNEKGEIVPILADKWSVDKTGKNYQFFLRKDLIWNNGEKFTARDINYKFKDIEVIVPNDFEIDFKLTKKLPIFPTYLTQPIIKNKFVGVAGVYRVERSKIKYGTIDELSLTPTKNNVPALVYKFYDNETKMINAYKLGQINEMQLTKKPLADVFNSWKNTQVLKTVDYSRLLTLFFNLNSTELKQKEKKEVRQAMAMVLSQLKIADSGELANGPIPPISWAYNSDVRQASYNEEFIQKILKGKEKFNIELDTYEDYLDISNEVQNLFNDTNVKIDVNILSEKPTSYNLLLAYWKVPFDPDQYYYWHSTQTQGNISGYKSEKIDKLLEDGRDTVSVTDRKKIYSNFQKVIVDDVPAYFLYYPYIYTIRRK